MSEGDFDCCKPTTNSELVVGQEAYKQGFLDGYLAGVKEEKQRIITMTMEETK